MLGALIILAAVFRIPKDQVKDFTLEALNFLKGDWLNLVLFFLWIITLVICNFRTKILKKEIDRISEARNKFQKIAGSITDSSEA